MEFLQDGSEIFLYKIFYFLAIMTAICSVGLDMIAIPADTPDTTIAAMIADEAATT